MLNRMKWTSFVYALLYVAAGILLLLYPGKIGAMFCDLFGIALIVYGIINIVMYFMIDIKESLYRNDFASGIIKILLGIMVIYHKELFREIIPFLLAIAIVSSGFSKLQDGVDAARIGYPNGWQFLVLAAISVGAGLVVMLGVITEPELLLQVAGGSLLYSGLTDLYTTLYLTGKIKKYLDEPAAPKKPETPHPEEPLPQEEESTAAYVDWNTTATGMEAIREELSAPVKPAEVPAPAAPVEVPTPVEAPAEAPAAEDTDTAVDAETVAVEEEVKENADSE